jgi:hypothetical protein
MTGRNSKRQYRPVRGRVGSRRGTLVTMENEYSAGLSRRNEVQRSDEHAAGHALIQERRWETALARERNSSGWRAWHRISVVLWVLAYLSAILGPVGAITASPLYALWASDDTGDSIPT